MVSAVVSVVVSVAVSAMVSAMVSGGLSGLSNGLSDGPTGGLSGGLRIDSIDSDSDSDWMCPGWPLNSDCATFIYTIVLELVPVVPSTVWYSNSIK